LLVGSKPVDDNSRQISSGGDTAALNVGGVIALPEGCTTMGAADSALTIAFNSTNANDIVFGPQPGQLYSSVVISCQSERKDLPFSKYPLIAGGNQGHGQIYPHGTWYTYNSFRSQSTGVTVGQHFARGGSGTNIALAGSTGEINIQHLPAGSTLAVGHALWAPITLDAPLTGNSNVGGFGQADSPARILYQLSLVASVLCTQLLLVLKKKQFERSQLASD